LVVPMREALGAKAPATSDLGFQANVATFSGSRRRLCTACSFLLRPPALAFSAAPPGTTPWVMNRQSATRSFLARATTARRLMRPVRRGPYCDTKRSRRCPAGCAATARRAAPWSCAHGRSRPSSSLARCRPHRSATDGCVRFHTNYVGRKTLISFIQKPTALHCLSTVTGIRKLLTCGLLAREARDLIKPQSPSDKFANTSPAVFQLEDAALDPHPDDL
jgi:hypothetical protein